MNMVCGWKAIVKLVKTLNWNQERSFSSSPTKSDIIHKKSTTHIKWSTAHCLKPAMVSFPILFVADTSPHSIYFLAWSTNSSRTSLAVRKRKHARSTQAAQLLCRNDAARFLRSFSPFSRAEHVATGLRLGTIKMPKRSTLPICLLCLRNLRLLQLLASSRHDP